MSVAKDGPAEDQKVENTDLAGARNELVEALMMVHYEAVGQF
jgi:hypothetical protein